VALIAMFNSYYTFIQLDPKDVSEQLKKQVTSEKMMEAMFLSRELRFPQFVQAERRQILLKRH